MRGLCRVLPGSTLRASGLGEDPAWQTGGAIPSGTLLENHISLLYHGDRADPWNPIDAVGGQDSTPALAVTASPKARREKMGSPSLVGTLAQIALAL